MGALHTLTPEQAHLRLDRLLALLYPDHSRTYFQALIDQGFILLNGEIPLKRTLTEAGDELEITFPPTPSSTLSPEPLALDILYEDPHLLALNKPAGLIVHPGAGHPSGTLVNGLLHHFASLPGDPARPGLVHRLDKETSGLILVAKTPLAHQRLVEAFAARTIQKTYLAICANPPPTTLLRTLIGRHSRNRQLMAVLPAGKEAITSIRPLSFHGPYTLVEAKPQTGRTHQIRVHLQHLGCPILGDTTYGSTHPFPRHLLHAYRLTLTHPITQQPLALEAPIPEDMKALIR